MGIDDTVHAALSRLSEVEQAVSRLEQLAMTLLGMVARLTEETTGKSVVVQRFDLVAGQMIREPVREVGRILLTACESTPAIPPPTEVQG